MTFVQYFLLEGCLILIKHFLQHTVNVEACCCPFNNVVLQRPIQNDGDGLNGRVSNNFICTVYPTLLANVARFVIDLKGLCFQLWNNCHNQHIVSL